MTHTTSPTLLQQPIRIGQGFDSHCLVNGRPLIIGGVTVPHDKGLMGHSDADLLLHALIDALLGAVGLGDIGGLFPDTDAKFAGADSRVLLRTAYEKVQAAGYVVSNVDATIIAQKPKLATYLPAMVSNIACDLKCDASQVNLKAKTAEHMGALGREEGMAAQVVCLVVKTIPKSFV
jgi:2-C-methyl-D-erythritol 2,4-cyclodiphosphate synthase